MRSSLPGSESAKNAFHAGGMANAKNQTAAPRVFGGLRNERNQMNDKVNLAAGLEQAWTNFITFVPKLLLAAIVIMVGYLLCKLLCKLCDRALERVGFDRLVERGGVKRALARSGWDASDVVSKLVFYTGFLFVLQFAFGFFGPNPISALLTRLIAFLPNVLVAVLIVIVAAAVAAAVKNILQATLGALSYGRILANIAAGAIVVVGIFAALNQVKVAPAIVNGLFYAALAIIVGASIVAIGGGGIAPMRAQWEKALSRLEREAPRVKQEWRVYSARETERPVRPPRPGRVAATATEGRRGDGDERPR
jgi:hypothetical protein